MANQYTTSRLQTTTHPCNGKKSVVGILLVLRTIEQSKTTESQHDPLSNHRIDNSHKLCHYVSSFQIDALQLRGEHIFFPFQMDVALFDFTGLISHTSPTL